MSLGANGGGGLFVLRLVFRTEGTTCKDRVDSGFGLYREYGGLASGLALTLTLGWRICGLPGGLVFRIENSRGAVRILVCPELNREF